MRNSNIFIIVFLSVSLLITSCGARSTKYDPGPTIPPAAPSNLAALPLTESSIRLSWDDNSETETGFELYSSNFPDSIYSFRAALPPNSISYIDLGLDDSTAYYYILKAVKSDTFSTFTTCSALTLNHGFSYINEFPIPGFAMQIKKYDDYLYIANNISNISVIDISNLAMPTIASNVTLAGNVVDFVFWENRAYIAEGLNGLEIVDVSEPSYPYLVSTYNEESSNFRGVVVQNNRVYVNNNWNVRIYDLFSPDSLISRGTFSTGIYHVGDLSVLGNYLYLAVPQVGLEVVDVSNPYDPVLASILPTPGDANVVLADRFYVYLLDDLGMKTINVSNPLEPQIVGNTEDISDDWIAIENNRLYCRSNSYDGLKIYDINDGGHPVYLSYYKEEYSVFFDAYPYYPYIFLAKANRDLGIVRYDL